jgi:nucleoside-diphosphate-sugar epimerase
MGRFLVTGAQGCIGAWVVKNLVERNQETFVYDSDTQPKRLSMVLSKADLSKVQFIHGDVCDSEKLLREVERSQISHIIHLAGLQVPLCRTNPQLGALVNVVGTINIFETARSLGSSLKGLAYASSAGVFGGEDDYAAGPLDENVRLLPRTHYGAFKQCNEGNARVYFQDNAISSVGLRPHTVYGPGRDFGMTSGPTKAMKAVVVGRPYEIGFGGPVSMQFVDDTAKIFIACAESAQTGARIYNIKGSLTTVEELIHSVERVYPRAEGLIRCAGTRLSVASNFADDALKEELGRSFSTPLDEGIAKTIEIFERLNQEGRLDLSDLA